MEWTPRQKQAIDSRKQTLLVSAAAGSGKTAVLVERVKGLLLNDGLGIDNMLIVTFSNAAAAEMKEKIYKSLYKAMEESSDDGRRRFLQHQISLMDSANISTFHKFALEIVHRYYHIIGIEPGLKIIDEARQHIMKTEAMDSLFESRFASKDPDFRLFLDHYASSKKDDEVRDLIEEFYEFLQSLPDPQQYMDDISSGRVFEAESINSVIREHVCMRLDLDLQYLKRCTELMNQVPKLKEKLQIEAMGIRAIRDGFSEGNIDAAASLLASFKRETLRAGKEEKAAWEGELKERISAIRDTGDKQLKKAREFMAGFSCSLLDAEQKLELPMLKILCSLTEEYSSLYAEKKRKGGFIDFSDIEHFALKILQDPRVCREYRDKFAYVFIDEYQDSNMVQEALIQSVCRPDNLFMVGDVKQSIYKFRQAEPELFLGKYKRIKSENLEIARVIDLNSNFRSKAAVIDFVNQLFRKIMNLQSTGIEYDEDAALIKGDGYNGLIHYPVELYIADTSVPDGDEELPEAALDEEILELGSNNLEALQAARIIKEYHGRIIHDSAAGIDRPLQYKDMAILLRSAKGVGEIYYKALSDAGIPVYLQRNEGYFDAIEIQVFLNLLKIIDNKKRDLPLLSVLHFPVFGFDEEMLSAIRIYASSKADTPFKLSYNKAFELYAAEGDNEALAQKCRDFLSDVDRWKKLAMYTPLADFLWKLLVETDILNYANALPAGGQRVANLRALVDKAAAFEAESSTGLYGFISYIEAIKGKVNVGEVTAFSENSDAVRIMTIHKSKGLEFPFVLISGLGRKLSGNFGASPAALFHKDMGAAIKIVKPQLHVVNTPFGYKAIKLKKDMEELAESIRLLYVAMTRPKDIMIFSAASSNPQKIVNDALDRIPEDVLSASSFLDMILPEMDRKKIHINSRESLYIQTAADEEKREALKNTLKQGFAEPEGGFALSPEAMDEMLSFSVKDPSSEDSKRKYSVSQLAEIDRIEKGGRSFEKERKVPNFIAPRRKLKANERGSAYHTVMEHLKFHAGITKEEVESFAKTLVEKNILTESEFEAINPAKIAAFFKSEIGQRVLASPLVYKEAPFTVKQQFKGREIMVQGTIDCFFKEGDQWVLVDYKSNYIDENDLESAFDELRQSYVPQLAQYRDALEKITGTTVKEGVLYLFGLERELKIQ